MINILSQAGRVDYNTKEFILDTVADMENLNEVTCDAGSTAFIIETSEIYMKNGQGEWKLI
jgi:deoxyhypusine synthase